MAAALRSQDHDDAVVTRNTRGVFDFGGNGGSVCTPTENDSVIVLGITTPAQGSPSMTHIRRCALSVRGFSTHPCERLPQSMFLQLEGQSLTFSPLPGGISLEKCDGARRLGVETLADFFPDHRRRVTGPSSVMHKSCFQSLSSITTIHLLLVNDGAASNFGGQDSCVLTFSTEPAALL